MSPKNKATKSVAKLLLLAKRYSKTNQLYVSNSVKQSFCVGFLNLAVDMRKLLIIGHIPSSNTLRLREAVLCGARKIQSEIVDLDCKTPFEASALDTLSADAIILGTTENLGYMSGALKDFFDRTYNETIEKKEGLPCAIYIRAGMDGTGTRRAIESIISGQKWRLVQAPLIFRGEWNEDFVRQAEELGEAICAGLDAGIF